MNSGFVEKYKYWYFPLRASYPQYRKEYLDQYVGKNPHHSDEEREHFMQLLFDSLSLSIGQKKRVFYQYQAFSLFQLNELKKVWEEESEKFEKLQKLHPDDVIKLNSKRGIEWIFVIDIDDIDLLLSEVLYNNIFTKETISSVLRYILEHVELKAEEKYVSVFESYEDKHLLSEKNWNSYLYNLCELKQYKKALKLNLPKSISTPFLEACKVSYVIKYGAFDEIEKNDIKTIIEFVRGSKDKLVRYQFLQDLYYYYYYKNNDTKKFINRLVKIFSLTLKNIDVEKNNLDYIYKSFTYIKIILSFCSGMKGKEVIDFFYSFINRHMDFMEEGRNAFLVDEYYESNFEFNSFLNELTFNVNSFSYVNLIMDRNAVISLHPYSGLKFSILTTNKDKELKELVKSYLVENKSLRKGDLIDFYMLLKARKKNLIAEYLMTEQRKIAEGSQIKCLIDSFYEFSHYNQADFNISLEKIHSCIDILKISLKESLNNGNKSLENTLPKG